MRSMTADVIKYSPQAELIQMPGNLLFSKNHMTLLHSFLLALFFRNICCFIDYPSSGNLSIWVAENLENNWLQRLYDSERRMREFAILTQHKILWPLSTHLNTHSCILSGAVCSCVADTHTCAITECTAKCLVGSHRRWVKFVKIDFNEPAIARNIAYEQLHFGVTGLLTPMGPLRSWEID